MTKETANMNEAEVFGEHELERSVCGDLTRISAELKICPEHQLVKTPTSQNDTFTRESQQQHHHICQ